jgi:hypothetical protein
VQGRAWQPLAFFSKKLSPTQARYSTFDRELLIAFSAVRHFRFLLEGLQFNILTDHKPLVAAISRVSLPWSARQQRQMAYLAEFTANFRHTSGATNVVADALSRPSSPLHGDPHTAGASQPNPAAPSRLEGSCRHAALRSAKSAVESTAHLPGRCRSGIESSRGPASHTSGGTALSDLLARRHHFAASGFCRPCCSTTLLPRCGLNASLHGSLHLFQTNGRASVAWSCSTGEFRPLLPPQFRPSTLHSLHNIAQPGIRAYCRLVSSRFCWPHLSKQDRTTRWPEAIPLAAITAADCAAGFFYGWVQRFGIPATITSHRGPQFASSLWSALCSLLNISHVQTTAYRPQANGAVERFHRRLKDALRACAAGADWHAHLPWVLLGIRSAWRGDKAFSPSEVVFGAQPVLPGQFLASPEPPSPSFLKELQETINSRTPPLADHHNRPGPLSLPEELLLPRFLLVRRDSAQPPLSPMYNSPYLVLERSLRFFKNQVGTRQDTVSTLRLKPCRSPSDAQPAVPPRRGRTLMDPSAATMPADVFSRQLPATAG